MTFREELKEWEDILQIISTTESFVRKNGLYSDCHLELKDIMALMAHTERNKIADIIPFLPGFNKEIKLKGAILIACDHNITAYFNNKAWCSLFEKVQDNIGMGGIDNGWTRPNNNIYIELQTIKSPVQT